METDWSVAWFLFIIDVFAQTHQHSATNDTHFHVFSPRLVVFVLSFVNGVQRWDWGHLNDNYHIKDSEHLWERCLARMYFSCALSTSGTTSPCWRFWLGAWTWTRNPVQSPPVCHSYRLGGNYCLFPALRFLYETNQRFKFKQGSDSCPI